MSQIIVQKFGGTSVADNERLFKVADIITKCYKREKKVVVVVSAQGSSTNDLIKRSKEISDSPSSRELDVLLSVGEQISSSLLAITIGKMGFPVISLMGWQVPIRTDLKSNNSKIVKIEVDRINAELDNRRIVIIAGFQGLNDRNDITTLGRGGSDTTAVALAAVLNAEKCEIYTDVDGVYTTDPNITKDAKKLSFVGYDEMLELASSGAKVLHNRSVELAKKYNVPVEVKSSFDDDKEGTIVEEGGKVESMLIRGVAKDENVSLVSLIDVESRNDLLFNIFSLLSKKNVNVDIIVHTKGVDDLVNVSFTVCRADLDAALRVLLENKHVLNFNEIKSRSDVAKLSIVGSGMIINPGIATTVFEALYESDIEILLVSTSEIKIAVIVEMNDINRAAKSVHDKFF